MEVSVVVPVYNSEKTLMRTLTALQGQTFQDFEVLLVDNCSRDRSGEICRAFCRQDPRFRYIYTDVKGVSNARNLGMSMAEGTYLCFCDADDCPDRLMLETLRNDIVQYHTDCVMCNYYTERDQCNSEFGEGLEGILDHGQICEMLVPRMFSSTAQEPAVWGTVWRCIFSREKIHHNRLQFDCRLTFAEDLCFLLTYLCAADSIYLEPRVLYRYMMTEGSAMLSYHHFKPDLAQERVYLIQTLQQILQENGIYEAHQSDINTIFQEYILECVGNAAIINETHSFAEARKEIRALAGNPTVKNVFRTVTTDNLKHRMVFLLIKYRCSLLLTVYYRIRRG